MPTKTRTRKAALAPGKSADAIRSKGSAAVRERREETAAASAVIGASVHALILKPITGIDVSRNMHAVQDNVRSWEKARKYDQMITDLWACYRKAMKRFHDITASVEKDFPKAGTFGEVLQEIIRMLRENAMTIFPEGVDMNVEYLESEDRYRFIIYRVCRWTDGWFPMWDIGPMFRRLKKQRHYALHDLLLSFVRSFCASTGVSIYYDGSMDYSEMWLDEEIQTYLAEGDHGALWDDGDRSENTRYYDECLAAQRSYRFGEAAAYAEKIRTAPFLSPDEIRARLKRIRRDHPLKKAIATGCWIMDFPFRIEDYNYDGNSDPYQYEGLHFHQQTIIVWDMDPFTEQHGRYIESMGNKVDAMEPAATYEVDAKEADWEDVDQFINSWEWPKGLATFFEQANTL